MPIWTRLLCAALVALLLPVCARKVTVPLRIETFMVRLPGGTYTMGKTGKTVTVQPFFLDVTAVTVAAYEGCVSAGKCTAPGSGGGCNWGMADRANHPVNCVDWDQATAYCAAVGKRLPTDEEREWAARGTERGTRYPWGNDEPANQLCWNGGNVQRRSSNLGTCEVGSFPEGDSPQGLKDLAGNVWEWTSSADDSSFRFYFGGSWAYGSPAYFFSSNRNRYDRTLRDVDLGFRCARTP